MATGIFVNPVVSSLQMFRRAVLHILLSSVLFLSLLSSLSNGHVPPARTINHGARATPNKSAKNGTQHITKQTESETRVD